MTLQQNTKCRIIADHLINMIKNESLQHGDKLPTEQALCNQFGVSRVTVRAAYNYLIEIGKVYRIRGDGTYVNDMTTINHEGEVAFLPFVINTQPFNECGLQVVSGAEECAKENGCYLTIHSSNHDSQKEAGILETLINGGARSIIIFPHRSDYNQVLYAKLLAKGINLVFIDILPNGISGDLVSIDNIQGGYQITKHLIGQNYKRIAMITFEDYIATSLAERENGYRYAHMEASLTADPRLRVSFDPLLDFEQRGNCLERALDKLFDNPSPPDALFCVNDYLAVDTFNILQKMGLRVPDDVAIAGFDNDICSQKNLVPLTTIEPDYKGLGYYAAKLCLQNRASFAGHVKITLPTKLIVRNSTIRTV